jgi:GNAT superfamily N-acetyltransferase
MKILEYDQVDPLMVLHLNLLSLRYALTPERVALIRRLDPRPFPFFALYAVDQGIVVGQVGVFRLPVVTTEGPEDVGGVWAVSTHPAFGRHGIATKLLDEAHARMRAAGLRFSTLETSSHLGAHVLYLRQGYEDVATFTSALAERKTALRDTDLSAEHATKPQFHLAEDVFQEVAAGGLGFARRHDGFMTMLIETGEVDEDELWLISRQRKTVGYAVAKACEAVLVVSDLLLVDGEDAALAVSALARGSMTRYVRVIVGTIAHIASLRRADYRLATPSWSTFMIRPLLSDVTVGDANRLMGIGTERFVFSQLDTT